MGSPPSKILATADLHGNLPEVSECDLLLLGGDICPLDSHSIDRQLRWLDQSFRRWLENLPARQIVGIAGNHDFVFESDLDKVKDLALPWTYLQDQWAHSLGYTIYGLPWVPELIGWAFYQGENDLSRRYTDVPKGVDIVLSHGPPRGFGDRSVLGDRHCGAKSAIDMLNRVNPKIYVCGHIHEGFGSYRFQPQHGGAIDIYNVSYVDERYRPRKTIVEIII